MKLTKQTIVTLIEEVLEESIDYGGPEYSAGLKHGGIRATQLAKKGEKQTTKGLKNYIEKATEHRSASYKAGYSFAFQLMFSKQLGWQPSKGQLPYANARPTMPPKLFPPNYRNRSPLKEDPVT